MSIRHRLAGIVLTLALILGGTQALANQDMFQELEEEAQSIRELDLATPLDVTVKTRAELQQESLDSMEEDFPADDTADWNSVLIFLGYINEGDEISEIYTSLMNEQILGYYDPSTGQMVVVSDSEDDWGVNDKTTFVHETAHALQDQHYDLIAMQEDASTDDAHFATLGLIEGDATVVEMIYLIDNDLIDQYMKELDGMDSSAIDEAPFFLTESLYFPYVAGPEFVLYFWTEGGWDAVDQVWQNPPTTSEQIIHPEKYVNGEDAVPVAINDPLDTMGSEWRLLEYNENGELGTRIFLQNGGASAKTAERASEGWGGDATYIVSNDEETAMVWVAAWDTDDDAIEYFDTLAETENARLGTTREDVDDTTAKLSTDGWVGEIRRDDNVVTYYLTQSDNAMDLIQSSQEGSEVPEASPEGTAQPAATPAAIAYWVRDI